MRPRILVCSVLLLSLLAASALAAPPKKPRSVHLLTDWLAQKQGPLAWVASSSSEDDGDVSDVCMRETALQGCACYERRGDRQCCWSANVDAEMACCDAPASSSASAKTQQQLVKEAVSTGKCSYTQSYLEDPVEVTADDKSVTKIGTFSGTCTLNKHAAACGRSGMAMVTVFGDILNATNVVFEGKPSSGKRSQRCEQIFAGDCKVPRNHSSLPHHGNSSSSGSGNVVQTSKARSLLAEQAPAAVPAAAASASAAAPVQATIQAAQPAATIQAAQPAASLDIFMSTAQPRLARPAPVAAEINSAVEVRPMGLATARKASPVLASLPFKFVKDVYQGAEREHYYSHDRDEHYGGRPDGYEPRRGPHDSYEHHDDRSHRDHSYGREDEHHHSGYGHEQQPHKDDGYSRDHYSKHTEPSRPSYEGHHAHGDDSHAPSYHGHDDRDSEDHHRGHAGSDEEKDDSSLSKDNDHYGLNQQKLRTRVIVRRPHKRDKYAGDDDAEAGDDNGRDDSSKEGDKDTADDDQPPKKDDQPKKEAPKKKQQKKQPRKQPKQPEDEEEEEREYEKEEPEYEQEEEEEEPEEQEPVEDKPKYYAGSALVFSGTFYSVNKEPATRDDTGIYQAVQVEYYDDTPLKAAPAGAYVARPNEVYFRFVKGAWRL